MDDASRPMMKDQDVELMDPSRGSDSYMLMDTTHGVQTASHGHNGHDGEAHGEEHSAEDTTPWRLHVFLAEYPIGGFCTFCCLFIACLVILVPLIIVEGSNAIYFDTAVPMYMRDHRAYKRMDALTEGEDDSTWQNAAQTYTTRQSGSSDITLDLIFIRKDKDDTVITSGNLQRMQNIADWCENADGFDDHCRRVYNEDGTWKCKRRTSTNHFFDPDYFLGASDESYDIYPSVRNYEDFFEPSLVASSTDDVVNMDYSEENIDAVLSYWAGYGQGVPINDSTKQYVEHYYSGTLMPKAFYYTQEIDNTPVNSTLSNLFKRTVNRQFTSKSPLDLDVRAAMTSFEFGYPLKGYDSNVHKTDSQYDKVSEWCFEKLHAKLWHFAEKNKGKFIVRWGCGDMDSLYLGETLIADMMLALATFGFVYGYMTYTVGSFFLSSFGMAMIFMNFVPSLLLYRYITQFSYFGTLNFLSIFIILAIGADDIFVLVDTWQQVRQKYPDVTLSKRLTFTLKHAGKVMATTSASTVFSFIGNASSVFPGVYTFGAFAAWLVFVNYCAVVLFYPTILVVHETYFYTGDLKKGCCITKSCADNRKPECCYESTSCCYQEKTQEDYKKEAEQRPIDAWFENTFHRVVNRWRVWVLILFLGVFVIFFGFAVRLEPDPNPPQFYPDGNNYQEFDTDKGKYFAGSDSYRVINYAVFGIRHIDRTGTDYALEEDKGKVKYDKNITFSTTHAQEWLAQFCDDLLCGYKEYACRYQNLWNKLYISDPTVAGDDLYVSKCFMTAFREWATTSPNAHPNRTEIQNVIDANPGSENLFDATTLDEECTWGTFPTTNEYCFRFIFLYVWTNDNIPTTNPDYAVGTTNYDYWKEFVYAKDSDKKDSSFGADLKFFTVSVNLDAYRDTDYNDGIDLYQHWETFINNWKYNRDGSSSADQYGVNYLDLPINLKTIFFADKSIFAYYFLQRQIVIESLTGIAMSLGLALAVLIIATQNWIIACMATAIITIIVACVMGFTVMLGWKLGIIEAIIYVMVVGMSVDYVVHLSEAYLESGERNRTDRSRRMLGIVGASVLSGAISTLGGIVWLLLAVIVFFYKFGLSIFFLILMSVLYALFCFTAAVAAFGPEGDSGDVIKDLKRLKYCVCNGCKKPPAQYNYSSVQ